MLHILRASIRSAVAARPDCNASFTFFLVHGPERDASCADTAQSARTFSRASLNKTAWAAGAARRRRRTSRNSTPLWFTYHQSLPNSLTGTFNQLAGPNRVTPAYRFVVLINNDTIYASSYLDLTAGPVILTIPPTKVTYSSLALDPYRDIYDLKQTALQPSPQGGVYALIGPGGFSGSLPANVTHRVAMPLNAMTLIFRADRHPANSTRNQTDLAKAFRSQLQLQALSDYLTNPDGGATKVFPVVLLAFSFKQAADGLIARDPILFLRTLQQAVASARTPPLSPFQQALSSRFNALFGNEVARRPEFRAGAQLAHTLIVDRYHTHTGPTNWVHFCNIGNWDGGTQVIDRSAITEFCQYCNGISTAAYTTRSRTPPAKGSLGATGASTLSGSPRTASRKRRASGPSLRTPRIRSS